MTNREIVKQFVASHWSDQKIAEVAAFNEDGKMRAWDGCSCLVGVHTSQVLHRRPLVLGRCPFSESQDGSATHYLKGRRLMWETEVAYMGLGAGWFIARKRSRQRIFGELLREVMAEREAARAAQSPTLLEVGK